MSAYYTSLCFSDRKLGISTINPSQFSCPTTLLRQVSDIQALPKEIAEQDKQQSIALQEIQSRKNKFDEIRLQAEKIILESTLKKQLLLDEFRHKVETNGNHFFDIGSVTISNIKLRYINCNVKRYFLCVVTRKSTLLLSQICLPDFEGVVSFDINHTFMHMPANFKICVKVYILEVEKKTLENKIKDKLSCWFSNSNVQPVNCDLPRESLFKLWEQKIITISDVNRNNEYFLGTIDNKICIIYLDAVATVDTSGLFHMGWLEVSRDGLHWKQLWCVLKGEVLKCYTHPAAISPIKTIELKSCTWARFVKRKDRCRSKVLMLQIESETHGPFLFYLSTSNEWNQWKILLKLIPTLRLRMEKS